MITLEKPVCVAPTGDRCGEGAVWHAGERAVYWTDINRFLIHRYDEADQSVRSWLFDLPVTSLVLTDRPGTLAALLSSKVILWQPDTDERQDLGFDLPGWPSVRLNDGRADPRGSLWAGSMQNNVGPDGSSGPAEGTDGVLYRIDPDGKVSEWEKQIGISNTVAWSPDKSRFYFADTLANRICAYDYSMSTGEIAQPQPFLVGFSRGLPDGSAVDAEGYLWNCRYGGGCIVRVAPDGKLDRVIDMPVKNITTCTFGGPDLKTVYITTASNQAPESDRLAGSLFAIRSSVPGLPENQFRYFERSSSTPSRQ